MDNDMEPDSSDLELLDVDLDEDLEENFDPIEELGLDGLANDDNF